MNNKLFSRVLCAILSILLLLPCLVACKQDATTVEATKVVGTVDGENIYYDELYFLVNYYYDSAKAASGGDPAKLQAELDRLVKENITANVAILRLCEQRGLSYKESDWEAEIDAEITSIVTNSFEGDEEAYLADREESGLTERYLRYTIGLNLLYGSLLTVYPEEGLVLSNEAEIKAYIRENFIHVYHLALFNDSEEEKASNFAKLSEAADKLRSGDTTMYQLIKNGYSEDFSDPSANGYYIAKGTMERAYEDAAFALKVGEVSDVVEAIGENNAGALTSCYYVIQRVEHDEAYLNSHFSALQDEYYGSVIAEDLDEVKETMIFTPNGFYTSLYLGELLPPEESTSSLLPILLTAGALLVLTATVVIVIVVLKKKHAKKNLVVRKKG